MIKNNVISYFNMRALFLGIGISRILSLSKEYTLYVLIFGTILGSLIIKLFNFTYKKNILNIIYPSIIFTILLTILINLISTVYLTNTPSILIGIPFILTIMYIISKDKVTLKRLSMILLFFNLISYILSLVFILPYIDLNNYKIYTNTPLHDVILAIIEYAIYSTSITIVNKEKTSVKTYIVSSITMGIILLLTYGVLGNTLSSTLRYPEYYILKKISLFNFLENIENFAFFMWIYDVIISMSTCALCIKDNLPNKKIVYLILPFLLIINILLYNNNYIYTINVYKYSGLVLLFSFILYFIININTLKKKNF